MKKILFVLGIVIVLVLLGSATVFVKNVYQPSPSLSPTPNISIAVSPTSVPPTFCKPAALHATLITQGAAGNIYGTLAIKNTSAFACQIQGNQFIQAAYQVSNITVGHQGTPSAALLMIQPNQSVYSQIHYPNGPQCNGPTKDTSISFSYPISPNAKVTFQNQNGQTIQSIPVCSATSEITNIDVWSLSNKPISP